MKQYFLGYYKAIFLSILAIILSTIAYLNWFRVENLANHDVRLQWENIRLLIIGFCFMPSITIAWLTYADQHLNQTEYYQPAPATPGIDFRKYIPIILICIILYVLLAMLMYGSWMQGDEFGKAWNDEKLNLTTRISAAFGSYLATVSRSGDFLLALFPLPSNRWPCYIITPFVIVLLPFFIARLMAKKSTWWTTREGIYFYIFTFFLLLLSVHIKDYWRDYRCHAAAVNYLWPTCATILFLSYYNPANWASCIRKKHTKFVVNTGIFLLGLYCGWGTECGTIAIAIILTSFYAWHTIKRKKVPSICTIGTAGFMWGVLLITASPALKLKSLLIGSFGKWHLVSSAEITSVVHNLSWQKIIEYNGGYYDSIIVLKNIPLLERIYFIPYLAERFWQCCQIPAIIAALLFIIILCFRPNKGKKQIVMITFMLSALASVTTLALLAGAIPTSMTFLTSSYIVAILACYLFINLPNKKLTCSILSILIALGSLAFYIPLGIEGWHYKKYEHDYIAEIHRQKAEGIRDLVITYPILQKPQKNTLKLIPSLETLNGRTETMAKIYGVDSIRFVAAQNNASSSEQNKNNPLNKETTNAP